MIKMGIGIPKSQSSAYRMLSRCLSILGAACIKIERRLLVPEELPRSPAGYSPLGQSGKVGSEISARRRSVGSHAT
jgi:hypothetical protein